MIALTHVPSVHMHAGLRTFVDRVPIDHDLAMRQHVAFRRMLARCGAVVHNLDSNRHLADCAFVEDAAVVLDELAILTSMGAAERRLELPVIGEELAKYRSLERVELPATLEGGDVLRVGRTLLVRSRAEPRESSARSVVPCWAKTAVPVKVRFISKRPVRPWTIKRCWSIRWLNAEAAGFELPVGKRAVGGQHATSGRPICADCHPRTIDSQKRGHTVGTVDLSEFAGEAGITCLCILFEQKQANV